VLVGRMLLLVVLVVVIYGRGGRRAVDGVLGLLLVVLVVRAVARIHRHGLHRVPRAVARQRVAALRGGGGGQRAAERGHPHGVVPQSPCTSTGDERAGAHECLQVRRAGHRQRSRVRVHEQLVQQVMNPVDGANI